MKKINSVLVLMALFSLLLVGCRKDCREHCTKQTRLLPMSGLQEAPSRETRGSGNMKITYNKCTKELTYAISWKNLTGNIQGSHIHGTAAMGVNAPVKHDFTSLIPKTTAGDFTNTVKIDGIAIKEDSLLKGFYYINLHTPKFPGGEIRGQIVF